MVMAISSEAAVITPLSATRIYVQQRNTTTTTTSIFDINVDGDVGIRIEDGYRRGSGWIRWIDAHHARTRQNERTGVGESTFGRKRRDPQSVDRNGCGRGLRQGQAARVGHVPICTLRRQFRYQAL